MINKKKLISLIITIAITLAICLVILNIIDWSETWGIIRGVSFKYGEYLYDYKYNTLFLYILF